MKWRKRRKLPREFTKPEFPLQRFATDENVKAIFDHCRNLLLIGALGAVGDWYWNHAPTAGAGMYLRNAVSIAILGLAVVMYFLNQAHGLQKLHHAGWSARAVMAFGLFYNILAMTIITTAARRGG